MMKDNFNIMLNKMRERLEKLSFKQNTITAILLGVVGFGLIIVISISKPSEKKLETPTEKEQKIEEKLGVAEDLWRGGQEDKLNDAHQKLSGAMKEFEEFKKKSEAEISDAKNQNAEIKKSNDELIKKVDWLTSFVEEAYMSSKKPENNLTDDVVQEEQKKIKQISIIDVASKTSDSYVSSVIPANSFVDAVVLEGADISTGTSSSGDPKPVLLQVTNLDDLPEKFRKNFQNCRIMTSSRAEVGTRRSSARLETITCEYIKTGRRITAKVSGYIGGEDSKEGLRSELIETNQDMLARSLFGGIAGNLAGGGRSNTPSFVFPAMTPNTNPQKPFGDVLMGKVGDGLAAGIETSADRWSKFQLEEAEKRMPFLELNPGRKVTIVFTEESKLETGFDRQSLGKRKGSNNIAENVSGLGRSGGSDSRSQDKELNEIFN
jgi:hypothetical protein